MVRYHAQFVAYLKDHAKLKAAFTKKTLSRFLMDMKFSKNGLITFRIPQDNKVSNKDGFLLEVFGILGIGPSLAKTSTGFYCDGEACYPEEGVVCLPN